MEKQVLDSPFTKKEFLNLVKQFNDNQVTIFEDFAITDKKIVNIGNRDFVDYRPTSKISKEILETILFQSLILTFTLFPDSKILKSNVYKSIRVKKADISVNLLLPEHYDDYLQNLTKKNRHELKRKKEICRSSRLI